MSSNLNRMKVAKAPGKTLEKREMPVAETWWGDSEDLRCGSVAGRITSGGWRWKVASEGAIWLWLNCEGSGLVWGRRDRFILKPGMYAMTGGGKAGEWTCVRYPGMHAMEVVVISREWLHERLGKNPEWLHPDLAKWLKDGGSVAFCGLMGVWERELCEALAKAARQAGPDRLLAEARVLEWAAVRLFRTPSGDGGGFCTTRHSNANHPVFREGAPGDENQQIATDQRPPPTEVGL